MSFLLAEFALLVVSIVLVVPVWLHVLVGWGGGLLCAIDRCNDNEDGAIRTYALPCTTNASRSM